MWHLSKKVLNCEFTIKFPNENYFSRHGHGTNDSAVTLSETTNAWSFDGNNRRSSLLIKEDKSITIKVRYTLIFAIVGLASFLCSLATAQSVPLNTINHCEQLKGSVNIGEVLSVLKKTKTDGVWGPFDLSKHTLLILDSEISDQCGLIVRNNEPALFLQFPFSYRPPNGVYETYYDSPSKRYVFEPKSFYDFLNTKIKEHTLIYDVQGFVALAKKANINLSDPAMFNSSVIIHEAFHLFGQDNGQDEPYWKRNQENPVTASREKIVEQCYQQLEIKSLFESELKNLKDAVAFVDSGRNSEAIIKAKQFVANRHQRYQKLSRINLGTSQKPATCEIAENYYEKMEGVPTFVAYISLENFGDRFVEAMKPFTPNEFFYPLGEYQLRFLHKICPAFDKVAERISLDTALNKGVHSEFARCLQ